MDFITTIVKKKTLKGVLGWASHNNSKVSTSLSWLLRDICSSSDVSTIHYHVYKFVQKRNHISVEKDTTV